MKDPYQVLGVDKTADVSTIKKAYRRKAKQYHPDLNPGDDQAAKKFRELSEAYDILQDPEKRQLYDTYGEAAFDQAGGMGGSNFSGFGFDMNDIFGDLISDLFGTRSSASASSPNRPRQGADIRLELKLSFKESYFGTKKPIAFDRDEECGDCHGTGAEGGTALKTCPTCQGRGVINSEVATPFGRMIQQRTCPQCGGRGQIIEKECHTCHGAGRLKKEAKLEVNIPAGVSDGNILPLRGQGHGGSRGGLAGDVYVILRVAPSEIYERHGNDLYMTLPVSFVQATLGDEIEVPTMEERAKFTLPAGTQSGTAFTLKGKGVKDVRSGRPGDFHFAVEIQTPTHLKEKQKEALRAFADAMGEEPEEKTKNFWDKVKDFFD